MRNFLPIQQILVDVAKYTVNECPAAIDGSEQAKTIFPSAISFGHVRRENHGIAFLSFVSFLFPSIVVSFQALSYSGYTGIRLDGNRTDGNEK